MKKTFGLLLLYYFRFWAKIQLLKSSALIVGVTGSAGKSSTRDALVCVFKPLGTIKYTAKANSESGIPLDILGLHINNYSMGEWFKLALLAPWKVLTHWQKYDVYIVEMGIDSPDEPKNMSYLLSIIQPDIGIILNAGAVHAEAFDHLITASQPTERRKQLIKLIATEKGKIVTTLGSDKHAIIFADQPEIEQLSSSVKAHCTFFGTSPRCDIQVSDWQPSISGTLFEFYSDATTYKLSFPGKALPKHSADSFAAAIAAAKVAGVPVSKAVKLLEDEYQVPEGRCSLFTGIKDTTIIDSSYNSSTQPLLDMLDLLAAIAPKRKVAVLGDMREIGTIAQLEHETAAHKIIDVCDLVILIGPQMQQFALPILKKSSVECHWYKTAGEAARALIPLIQKKDTILVKASQNTLFTEIVVEALLARPDQDRHKLCRRGEYWDKIRAKYTI